MGMNAALEVAAAHMHTSFVDKCEWLTAHRRPAQLCNFVINLKTVYKFIYVKTRAQIAGYHVSFFFFFFFWLSFPASFASVPIFVRSL